MTFDTVLCCALFVAVLLMVFLGGEQNWLAWFGGMAFVPCLLAVLVGWMGGHAPQFITFGNDTPGRFIGVTVMCFWCVVGGLMVPVFILSAMQGVMEWYVLGLFACICVGVIRVTAVYCAVGARAMRPRTTSNSAGDTGAASQ